jgi:uncharacterized damage-inducible protein DinB
MAVVRNLIKHHGMKEFFKDIFEYHSYFNQKLTDQLIENAHKLPERTIPVFCHVLNAHQIWNARILEEEPLGVDQLHKLEKCKEIDDQNYRNTLKILDKRELDEKVNYQNSKGIEFQNSIQQILFHVANHFSHHKGQIISDIRQAGIDPIATDYIFYKR